MEDIAKLTKLYESVESKEADWQADAALEAQTQATEGERTEDGLPVGMNVLTQEANMEQVPQGAPRGDMTGGADMDMGTPDGMAAAGQWNAPPAM
jgi:hypothetical protein